MENKKQLCASGFLEAYITEKNGKMRKVYEGKNVISQTLLDALADEIGTAYNTLDNIALDNLFVAPAIADYGDGIACLATSTAPAFLGYFAMNTTISQPTSVQFRATGVYTNGNAFSVIMTAPQLGKSWVGVPIQGAPSIGAFNDFVVASGGMSAQTVPASAVLTIVWTITFTVH